MLPSETICTLSESGSVDVDIISAKLKINIYEQSIGSEITLILIYNVYMAL